MANSIGDVFHCDSCGAEVTVSKACTCKECSIVCCGKPMKPKDAPTKKAGGCSCCG